MIRSILRILKIRREERPLAVAVALLFIGYNALVLTHYGSDFIVISDNCTRQFLRFHVSGFDPLTYIGVSDWNCVYNVHRHPLLANFIWPLYILNQGLMQLTGVNCAIFIIAFFLVAFALYTFLFCLRIGKEVIGLKHRDAALVASLYMSFAYVILALIVPDHFALSMLLLTILLYVTGRKIKEHRTFTIAQSVVVFVLTAGVSLNNGIKVFLATLFANRKRFFRIRFLAFAVVIPALAIWGYTQWEYKTMVVPIEKQRVEARKHKKEMKLQRLYKHYCDTAKTTDSVTLKKEFESVKEAYLQREAKRLKRHHQLHNGTPAEKTGFLSWTDISTPRGATIVENVFGESIQLHEDYLLLDALYNRPIIVGYKYAFNYIAEALLCLLFALGIVAGRRNRLLMTALSFFAFDAIIHLVLGFGINEIYIMAPHWLVVIPISIACLMKTCKERWLPYLRGVVTLLTCYLFVYNTLLLFKYFV